MDTASLSSVDRFVKGIDGDMSDPNKDRFLIYNELQNHLNKEGVSSEVMWRLTRAALDLSYMSEINGDENDKRMFILEALNYGKQSVNLDEDDPNCHKWYAVALDLYICDVCEDQTEIKQKTAQFLEHINIAIKAKPNDAFIHHIYGVWFYKWAQIGFWQKLVALLCNFYVPKASFESAIKEFSIAHQINPGWKANTYYLAKSLIAKKQFADSIKVIKVSLKEKNQHNIEINLECEKAFEHELELLYDKYSAYDSNVP
ncbi:regulator of microtubule dynamics protein 2-like protein [Leptotrombidium deliense]|uniref:Regulator of microtubule dynamics protein 1 n=1 Tax=Leptotrombidium deliense TaxID=299467 RepID=A0A443SIN1_9ACAR|nr:regulator of microtubule dynamics protein 2-like protein [Leptotrombidium deliense]